MCVWQPRDWLVYARAGVYLTCASLYCTFRPISPTTAIAQWARCSGLIYGIGRVFESRGGIGALFYSPVDFTDAPDLHKSVQV